MPKKKKKSKGGGSRGYATTSVAPRTASAAPNPTTKVTVTARTRDALDDLHRATNDDDDVARPSSTSSATILSDPKRLSKRVTRVREDLRSYGFSENDVAEAVVEVGATTGTLDTEACLDRLCARLTNERLPPLFREENDEDEGRGIRSVVRMDVILNLNHGDDAAKRTIEYDDGNDAAVVPSQNNDLSFVQSKQDPSNSANDATKETSDDEDEKINKAWLLERYAYEEEEDIAEEEKEAPTETIAKDVGSESVEQTRLEELERRLTESKRLLNDDVENYMRSKHETKELKKDVKKMEGQVRKLRDKVRKQQLKHEEEEEAERGKQQSDRDGATTTENADVDDVTKEEDQEEEGGGLFSLFDEDATEDMTTTTNEPPPPSVLTRVLRPRSIPKGWTGTTPRRALDDHCKKHKLARPKYRPCEDDGRELVWSSDLSLSPVRTFDRFEIPSDADEWLAVEALYRMDDGLPLYRLFPPSFRGTWREWTDAKRRAQEESVRTEKVAEEAAVRRLVDRLTERAREMSISTATMTIGSGREATSTPAFDRNHFARPSSDKGDAARRAAVSARLCRDLARASTSEAVAAQRRTLPMFAFRAKLLSSLRDNPVVVLCGETGCGKTTQCPQYLLEEGYSGSNNDVDVVCTQPRRVAATSVAERVAEEVGIDGVGGVVGYRVRLESADSERTRLTFCTTGVLLRRLQDDPELSGVTHVVVDEVHERQWQIDLLLIALRNLVTTTRRRDLRILLMSATLDSKTFCGFFGNAPLVDVPGRTFPVNVFFLEDLLEATGHIVEEDSPCAKRRGEDHHRQHASLFVTGRGGTRHRENVSWEDDAAEGRIHDDDFYPGYSLSTRRSLDRIDEKVVNYDLIEDLLRLLTSDPANNPTLVAPESEHNNKNDGGAILVFLPGLGEIRALTDRLKGSRTFGGGAFETVAMHSSLSPKDQRRAFLPTPGRRKIIVATNIAETSVTIPDVVCVIDAGLVREVRQNERTFTSTLALDWCSKASAKQRCGRAGRVRPGLCLRLYSSGTFSSVMKDRTTPELQRIPLEEVCLTVLGSVGDTDCVAYLKQAPQPPSDEAVDRALTSLEEVGAIARTVEESTTTTLTPLGRHLAKLPVHVRLGKMLVFGSLFRCLEKSLTIAATLSASKSPFSVRMEDAGRTAAARRVFLHPTSDFLTLCNVWEAYETASASGGRTGARRFCDRHLLNHNAMMEIDETRKQFRDLLRRIGFSDKDGDDRNGANDNLVTAVVCAGLYPNVARVEKTTTAAGGSTTTTSYSFWHGKERVHIHSSSVNHGTKESAGWILFHEKFATSKTYVSVTSVVKPFPLLLFGNTIKVKHLERKVVVDDQIELSAAAKTGVMFRELHRQLDTLLEKRMMMNKNDEDTERILDGIVELISNE